MNDDHNMAKLWNYVLGLEDRITVLESRPCCNVSPASCAGGKATDSPKSDPSQSPAASAASTATGAARGCDSVPADVLPPADMPEALLPYWMPESRVMRHGDTCWAVFPAEKAIDIRWPKDVLACVDEKKWGGILIPNRPSAPAECPCGGTADPASCIRVGCPR